MVKKQWSWWILPVSVLILVGFLFITDHNEVRKIINFSGENREGMAVFVSILPQKFFVQRIGGEKVDVSVLVGPGHSPATYEPLPKQMAKLSRAVLYFSIGVPFEEAWLEKIRTTNPQLKMVDTREGIPLRRMEGHNGQGEWEADSIVEGSQRDQHEHGFFDPHIWLDPLLVKIQAQNICKALVDLDPGNKAYYEQNLSRFQRELNALDQEVEKALTGLSSRKLMAFHPAWGYLCDRYGLRQIPIEAEGKEPGAKELAGIIEEAKAEKVKVILVQAQFSSKQADAVAKAINGKVLRLDPLAEDYINNLTGIARVIREELK